MFSIHSCGDEIYLDKYDFVCFIKKKRRYLTLLCFSHCREHTGCCWCISFFFFDNCISYFVNTAIKLRAPFIFIKLSEVTCLTEKKKKWS